MTYSIDIGFAPNIRVVQTTQYLNNQTGFDTHPEHSLTEQMTRFQKQFHLPHPLVVQKQEHKDRAVEYNIPPTKHFMHRADACFTKQQNTICAIMTADCLPVLLADKNGHWVSAIHCGWRSLHQNIIAKTFAKIKANPTYTQAYLGPCIQQAAYEVGEDFVKHFLNSHPACVDAFTPPVNGKSHANLQQIARHHLSDLGIQDILASPDCTYTQGDVYYSWRRNQTPKRMSSLIWYT